MKKRAIKIELNTQEDAIIYYEKTMGKNITTRKRAAVIYYASKGAESITELRNLSGFTAVFVRNTLKGYAESGINYIYECSRGIKQSVLDTIEPELLDEFEKNPPSSIPEAVSRIKELFGIALTDTPVRYWLKKRGFRCLKSKPIPAKANLTAQLYFLDNILIPLLKMAEAGIAKVYFSDGVHLIYGYESGKCWCRKRVCVKSAYGRKRVNCLGFLDAVSHKVETVMNDTYLNADSVCEGLKMIRQSAPDEWLYIILDNAAYQRCKKVKECAEKLNINLIFLPPYSPNLNLIERLWKFLRNKVLANKYYTSFNFFFNKIHDFLTDVHLNFASALDSLLSFNFQCLDSNDCIY